MRARTFGMLLLLFAAGLGGDAGGERYALLAGNDRYLHFRREQWLNGCANDVRLVRSHLIARFGFQPENIRLLINEEVTCAAVLDSLENWLIADKRAGDVLVFYWSGHGKQIRDDSGDEAAEDGLDEVLAPYDFRMTSRETAENYIADDRLNAIARRAGRDKTFVAIFDCCHSGTGLRAVSGATKVRYLYYEEPTSASAPTSGPAMRGLFFEPEYDEPRSKGDEASAGYDSPIRQGEQADNVALIAAARPHELAAESEPVQVGGRMQVHGALTLELTRGLGGKADSDGDGRVTFGELETFLSKPIVAAGNTQHPMVEMTASLRETSLFGERASLIESNEKPAIPDVARPRLIGIQPLAVAVAPYDVVAKAAGDFDPDATAELRRDLETFLADLASSSVVAKVEISDPYEELILYSARRTGEETRWQLGVVDSTAHFSLRKEYGRRADLLRDARAELERAYTVMNLMRLRQPPDSRDRLELAIQPAGRARFRLGEAVAFRVRAGRSGYLTMINVTADGQAVLIYPNDLIVAGADRRRREGYIEGGRAVALPQEGSRGTYQIREPLGNEFIKAFLTERPTRIFAGLPRPQGYAQTTAGAGATGAIFRGLTRGVGGGPDDAPEPPTVTPSDAGTGKIDFEALASQGWAEASLSFVTTD